MKTIVTTVLTLILLAGQSISQEPAIESPEQFALSHLSAYLGLKPSDISFRPDYMEPDSFRFTVVADLMSRPLDMIPYTENLKGKYVYGQPEILAGLLKSDLKVDRYSDLLAAYKPDVEELAELYNSYLPYYSNMALGRLLQTAASYLELIFPKSTEMMLARLSGSERKFLTTRFKELLATSVDEEFLSAEALDSMEKAEEGYTEEFVTFGTRIDKSPIVAAGIDCLRDILLEVRAIKAELRSSSGSANNLLAVGGVISETSVSGSYLGKQSGWFIGGPGNDYYSDDYRFILDVGGDDVYNLSYDPSEPHGVIIIDLSGNDTYKAATDFSLGSGCLSAGILIDLAGDDRYDAKSFGLGSGYFGFGVLYDAEGDDIYNGDTHVQGAASFGLGLLIDESGRDIYNSALYSQGFGFVEGIGLIFERDGADSYYAGGKYKDHLRYDDHYLSLSQGFGYGLRPYMSGGIGAIVDIAGNDTYYSDIFAQGCSYWWSLGIIYDSAGNDNYQSFQYAQGSAAHMSLGILLEESGNDVYFGKGLMQGCGHDYSCGLILDRHGDDTYTASDLSQAAGSANGAGIQIDITGNDRYFSRNPLNTQGYGNPRRSFGSIGLFIDLGGADQYSGEHQDNQYWISESKWGGGMDIELTPKPDSVGEGE